MKEFLIGYAINLWVYGSQALILYFAGRRLVQAARNGNKGVRNFAKQDHDTVSDIRDQRVA
jgi:hypothetical protein